MVAANIITSNQEDYNHHTVETAGLIRQEMGQSHSLLTVSYIPLTARHSSVTDRIEQFGNCTIHIHKYIVTFNYSTFIQ